MTCLKKWDYVDVLTHILLSDLKYIIWAKNICGIGIFISILVWVTIKVLSTMCLSNFIGGKYKNNIMIKSVIYGVVVKSKLFNSPQPTQKHRSSVCDLIHYSFMSLFWTIGVIFFYSRTMCWRIPKSTYACLMKT